ncbi:hypothetical protein T265_07887 [Opisthorchis viverrini]|uniref:DNA topoisomerase (ATP-hydrolyzing) n=1 Tax=Opisthorchis viverrini TaxID=6198 RepID=A0A074ZAX9_OPIVI|nr:hypothetical protein T265_07887 [Opisthorchis viverrini]KER24461.1 hypothetical protein T265_07887 [Opisthorchis viverrini]
MLNSALCLSRFLKVTLAQGALFVFRKLLGCPSLPVAFTHSRFATYSRTPRATVTRQCIDQVTWLLPWNNASCRLFSVKMEEPLVQLQQIAPTGDNAETLAAHNSNAHPQNKRLSVERIYQKKTQLEHILLRPDSYIGSTERNVQSMWVMDEEKQCMVYRDILFSPGLYKIFDEILGIEQNMIKIWNNGKGIPVVQHKVENVYVPTLIFGHLLTSSNYDDTERKVTGGRNGYGAKLCNIFSKKFIVETSSKDYKKSFRQVWTDNMTKTSDPKISPDKGDDFTCITFYPDLQRFGMTELDSDTVALFVRRAYDLAATTSGVKVFLNGKRLAIKSFMDYVDLYVKANKDNETATKVVFEGVNPRWQVAVAPSSSGFQQVSFVNGIATTKGGKHVDYIADQLNNKLIEIVKKKSGKSGVQIKPFQIRNHMWLFVNCLIENPTFDSQTKENMTLQPKSFGSTCTLSEKFVTQASKCGIVESVLSWVRFKAMEKLDKQCHKAKHVKLKGIPKLDDANNAGTKHSSQCTLILTEGDSAKSLAVAGLGVVGRDNYGVFPLRGKLLNVREASSKQIMDNAEINALIKIMGLQYKHKYENPESLKDLRYGKIMIMTDQDQDGSHIKGLIINFVHCNWPNLLKHNVLEEFITPIVKVFKGKDELSFYSLPEFEEWQRSTTNWHTWRIKYYKGLGTSSGKEAKQYFSDMIRHRIRFRYTGSEDDASIQLAFDRSRASERKNWLTSWTMERKRRRELSLPEPYLYGKDTRAISYHDFVHKELVLFSNLDNERSIPSMVLFTCLKRNLVKEIKVAQLAGSVAELSAYHHGEQSLLGTIVGLAQNFVGSNNLNVLLPIGQFGTRLSGGKDAASARYIFTALSPLTRLIFHPADDPLLNYLRDDNQRIEPEWYAPIVPMVLINGAEGIGTGYSTRIPNYNVLEVISNLYRLLDGEDTLPMLPSFRGFCGTIQELEANRYMIHGEVAVLDDDTIEITELPVRTWTQSYKETVLEPMLNGTDKVQPCISDYKEYHTDTTVRFVVKMSAEKLREAEAIGLHKFFKLSSALTTNSMVLFDQLGCLKHYRNVDLILREFFDIRLQWYEKRKSYLEGMLAAEARKLENQARFVLEKIQSQISIENKPRKELIQILKNAAYDSDPVRAWKECLDKLASLEEEMESGSGEPAEQIESGGPDYNYILGMPLWSLTKERKDDLLAQRDAKQNELRVLRSKTASMLWRDDLQKLEEAYKKFEADLAAEDAAASAAASKKLLKAASTGVGRAASQNLSKRAQETKPDPFGRRVAPVIDPDLLKKLEANRKKRVKANAEDNGVDVSFDDDADLEFDDLDIGGSGPPKPLLERLSSGGVDTNIMKPSSGEATRGRGRGRGRTTVTKPREPDSPVRQRTHRVNAAKINYRIDDEDESGTSDDGEDNFHEIDHGQGDRKIELPVAPLPSQPVSSSQGSEGSKPTGRGGATAGRGRGRGAVKVRATMPADSGGGKQTKLGFSKPATKRQASKKNLDMSDDDDAPSAGSDDDVPAPAPREPRMNARRAATEKARYVFDLESSEESDNPDLDGGASSDEEVSRKRPMKGGKRVHKSDDDDFVPDSFDKKLCKPEKSEVICSASGDRWIKRREQFIFINGTGCKARQTISEEIIVGLENVSKPISATMQSFGIHLTVLSIDGGTVPAPFHQTQRIPSGSANAPKFVATDQECFQLVTVLKLIINKQWFGVFKIDTCEAESVDPGKNQLNTSVAVYTTDEASCRSSRLSNEDCRSNNGVRVITYERRAGDECERRHVRMNNETCTQGNLRFAVEEHHNDSTSGHLTRARRSVGTDKGERNFGSLVWVVVAPSNTSLVILIGGATTRESRLNQQRDTNTHEYVGQVRTSTYDAHARIPVSNGATLAARCPPCRIDKGECNPETRNIEITQTCFRLQRDGQCKPLVTKQFQPCGECPMGLVREPGPCNYCQRQRQVVLRTFFREDGGLFRCTVVKHVKLEPCDCPPKTREGPICFAHRNQLAFKTINYMVQGKQCVPRIGHEWIPRPTCPPLDKPDGHQGKFECNPETCVRTWHKTTWHWEECKCKPITVTEPSGKCCCPKPRRVLSPCQKGMQKEQLVTHELVEGQCIRHVQNRLMPCTCPPPKHSYKCRTDTNERMIKTVLYKRLPDRNCGRIESVSVLPTACKEEGIRRITECVRKPGESRPTRNLLITTPKVDNCVCKEPDAKVVEEACGCPEAQEPPVKLIHKCPEICHQQNGDHCGKECNDVFTWQRFVYDERSDGNAPRCRTEIIRKILKPCLCPEHSELISTHCSPETNIETSKYRRHFQHNCECREEEITKHRPCGCSKPMFSEPVCDAKNNQIHTIKTVFDVVENKCVPRKVAVHKPVDCRPFELEEAKRNHGTPRVELHCDAKSGRGRLVAELWQPVNCRCVKRPQVIREGVCHCQSARIRWGPCNPRTGRRKLHLIYHRRDHCHCIREMRVMEKPCVCESNRVKKQSQCDSLRGILHTVFLTQHWSDKLHQCVPARIIKSTTIKCLPLARLFRAPCSEGKMLEKIVEPYRDVNECQCRKRIRTAVRDCRCPTKMLIDGKCDGHRTHWDELMVEQQWSEEKRACVVERIRRARHHCRCDDPKVFKECAKGVMHETKIISNLNERTGSCDRTVLQRQYKPACETLMGMESQAQHDQLFVRNKQTPCDPNTCTRQLETYTRRYDPGRCSCDWSLVKTRRCTCCGCPKPKVQVNCQNNKELVGQVIYYTTHQQRCGHQCIEKTHAVHSEVGCSPNVRKEQKCTHGLPELVTYHTVLHDGRCVEVAKPEPLPLVCPTKKEVRHGCLEKSNVRSVCVGSCRVVVQEIFKYDQQNERCIKENHIQRVCPECPKPHVIREECDRDNTCLQTIKHVDFVLEDCHCKRLERAEKVSCCCPKSTVLGTRCLEESGQVETKTLFYELVNGQCARRVKLDRMPVPCPPPGAEKPTPSCDPQTCLEPVLEQRWFRVGCRCVEQKPQQFRTCCCSNRIVRAKRICNPDGSSLLMTQSWLFHNGHCVPQVITKRLDIPVCHPQRVTALGTCDTVTRRQVALVERFAVKQCRCQAIFREKIERICACPAPVEHAEPCQPATCLQRIVRIPWALDEQKGQCVRLPLQVQMRPCCCLREKEPPAESTRCNPITGEVELTRRSFIFNVVKRVCEVQEDKRYNKLACSHLDHVLPPLCLADEGVLIKKHVVHHLRQNGCQPEEKILKETIVCAEGEHPRFQCNPTTCDSVRTVSLVERVGCRCVPRVREERGKCCCPEPTEQQECTNGGRILVLHKLSFILDKTRQTCVPQKDKVQKEIVCPKERITRGVCNRATGMRPLLRHYYELVGCKCHPRIHKDSEPCSCPLPETVKLPCDPAKPIRKVVRVSFDLEEDTINRKMRCAKRIHHIRNEPCACEPTKIEKHCGRGELVVIRKEHHLTVKGDEPTCVQRTYVKRVPVVCNGELTKIYRSQCEGFRRKVIHVREFVEANTCECRNQARVTFEACMCKGRHEIVQTSGCTIQKDNGLFQSEEVRWQQVVNCQCVTRRKQTLRLCGCPEPQFTRRCLDTVNMAVYKTTFIRIADECVPSQEVVTNEVRCTDPAKIVERSTCETAEVDPSTNSLPGCFETFQVAVRQVEDCKCVEKLVSVRRRCCTPEPVVTRQCDMTRGAWVTTLKKFTLVPGKNLFEIGSVVIRDHVLNVVREQQDERVVCPEPKVHENCDAQTGLWTRTVTRFEMVNCHCIPMRQVERGRCQCPPPRITETECKNNFRLRISDSYELINGKCVQRHDSKRIRCGCPKPVRRVYCDGEGRWVKCYTQFLLNPAASTCRLVKHCVRWYQDCPKDTTRVSIACSAQTEFKHTLQRVRFVNNAKTCHCDPQILDQWTEMCQCNHLNRKWLRCKLGLIEIKQLTHHLENGDCVPKMVKHVKLPDCDLIHPPRHARRCEEPAILHIKSLFWTPSEGKCIPGFAIYTKHIKCPPERKLRLGPCVQGTDGIGRRLVEQIEQRVEHCECVWKVMATQHRICKCSPPKHSKECVDGGKAILRTLIAHTLKDDMCAPIQRQIKENPCERQELPPIPPDQTGRCNPLTCSTERIHHQRVSVNCNCITQRVTIKEACCCPRPSKPVLRCHNSRNVMLHQQTFYQFKPAMGEQRAHCLPVMHVKSIAINCGPRLQRILVKKCDGEFHRVIIIRTVVENCLCKQRPTKELRIRCGCPRVIRRLPGACINQWANDRWIGFQAVVVKRSNLLKVNRVKCKPVIFEQKQRRCACPEPTETVECEGGKLRVKYRTIYKLNEELNNCEKHVFRKEDNPECPKRLHVIKGECDREIPNRRKLIWLQQRPVNCRCVWHRLIHPNPSVHRIKSSVACRCRPKITVRQCRPPVYGQLAQMRMITVNFQLRDGECRPESRVDLHPVDCKNGVRLINGECDPMTNTRIVKRIISHLEMNECRCVTREFERRCHCNCPLPKLYLHCQRQQGLVRHIKIVHFLAEDRCLCKAKRAIRTSKVVCPIKKRLIQKGPCQHIPGKSMDSTDKYRQVVWEVSHRDGCQCVTKRVVNSEPCFCTPQPIVEKRCIDDHLLETAHSERRLSEVDHKCIRIIVNKIAKPVECKVQAQLIHREQCDSTCQQRLVWRREVRGEDGNCRLQHRLERRACCCPQPRQLEPRCNAAKGLLEVGFRTFTLHEGVCVPKDQFTNKAVACEPNEQVTQHPQANGFVRVERHFNELDGCNCVRRKEVTLNKWNCPEPITKQRCTNPEPGLYTIETVSTRWHVPKESPVCSRLDTVVDSNPIDCSAKQLVRANACQLEPQRHATVRVDHLFTSVNDGCRCVRNPPTLKVHVCQCMKPEDHVMCDRERGLLTHIHTKYELSGDGTRCIPHKTKRIWRPSCRPTAPRHVRTTPCDPSTGLMYQIFEELSQKDCRCVNLEKRVPVRCHCAKPIQESRCLSPQIREIRTTTFHLTPEGTCGKTVLTHKEEVRCPLLPQLLQSSPMYRVQRSQDKPNLIQHVHACHSAGRCLYKVREFLVIPDQSCACRWKLRELVRACCCPTHPQPQPLSSRCDASKGLIVFRKVDWNKHNGVCRPNIHERVKHIVCHTVSTAEVVFMIDGAAAGRQTQYLERVQQLLFKTIEQFLLSHETKSQSNSFRFAVMTYADRPEIIFNLQNYEDPNRILEQVQELTLRGERANLALALHTMLRETKEDIIWSNSQVLPLKRPDIPVLLYIVTDGRDQDEDTVRLIGQVHRAQIQVTVVAMGAEPHGMNHLGALVTPPKAVHLLRISNTDNVNQYLTRISETLCSRACPANYVKASDCSRETGCVGRSYIHTYQFDGYKGHCVGETKVRTRRCCCMQQAPPPVRQCEQNRLFQIISNWQLTKDGTCSKFVIKRDATPLLLQQCSPPVDVRVGQCNAEGYAVELTVRRFLDNCECKSVLHRWYTSPIVTR